MAVLPMIHTANSRRNISVMKRSVVVIILSIIYGFSQAQNKPNIIYILADDLGYTDLGCYGNPFNETPNLDQLAKQGMLFSQAYAHPACSPSRAALLTGKHPARLQLTTALGATKQGPDSPVLAPANGKFLPSSEITLAEILKRNGYNTGMVGKWHLGGWEDKADALSQGFDYNRVISKNNLDYYNYAISSNNKRIYEDAGITYLTDKLSDYAVEFIQSQHNKKPFFLHLAYSAPHLLIVPKAEKVSKYMWKYNDFNGKYNPYYATMIESMDDGIGRLIDELKRLEMLENTLIIFSSDNGGVGMDQIAYRPTTMEPLRKWKGHVYEGGIRVPLIIYWKNQIQAGVKNDNYLVIEDFVPTIMEIIGDEDLPADIDGISFLPAIQHPENRFERGPIYFHFPHFSGQEGRPAGAVRNGEWKLVENLETGKTELYNLEGDISESRNLMLSHPQQGKQLIRTLKSWQNKIGAKMPTEKTDN